jgi:hypothetical protein
MRPQGRFGRRGVHYHAPPITLITLATRKTRFPLWIDHIPAAASSLLFGHDGTAARSPHPQRRSRLTRHARSAAIVASGRKNRHS